MKPSAEQPDVPSFKLQSVGAQTNHYFNDESKNAHMFEDPNCGPERFAAAPRSNAPSGSGTPPARLSTSWQRLHEGHRQQNRVRPIGRQSQTHIHGKRLELLPRTMICWVPQPKNPPRPQAKITDKYPNEENTTFDIINKPSPVPNTPSPDQAGEHNKNTLQAGLMWRASKFVHHPNIHAITYFCNTNSHKSHRE